MTDEFKSTPVPTNLVPTAFRVYAEDIAAALRNLIFAAERDDLAAIDDAVRLARIALAKGKEV